MSWAGVFKDRRLFGRCTICRKRTWLRHDTPADPPFYTRSSGRHCSACERWLLTGDSRDHS